MYQRLFPTLTGKWVEINLNEHAKNTSLALEDPYICAMWVNSLHKKLGVDYSFGGYLEDRSVLWQNHYMDNHIHLGVDFNVPVNTVVFSPVAGEVVATWCDPDTNGGWGSRIIIQRENVLFVLAHLASVVVPLGTDVDEGDMIGMVGIPEVNGGWFPHLHVQCVLADNPFLADGYAASDMGTLDPLKF